MRNIELKRISFSERLSEETYAYAADLWLDGKLFAYVKNDGHGGCDYQHPAKGFTQADITALNNEIKATYPEQVADVGKAEPFRYNTDLEIVCHELLTKWLEAKDLKRVDAAIKRKLAKSVVYFDESRGLRMVNAKYVTQHGKLKTIEQVHKQYPKARVLNDMPLPQAIAFFKEKSA